MGQLITKRPFKNVTKGRSGVYKMYAAVGADVDLYAEGYGQGTKCPCAEIHVFGGGNLVVQRPDGTNVTLLSVPSGWVLPIEAGKLISAGTTATNILVLW